MVVDTSERFPELAAQLDRIEGATRAEHNVYMDAQELSERLFGDHMMANTLALGAAYQRGARFLLNTQLEDGSWYVKNRSLAFQPYFESDFPHGHDQWISAAATNWAVMALAPAAR